ncbi:TPA: hypothetical protein QDA70_005324 [Burkholderia vietnamiensis]|nr:hypothetical protein [Burkholderia vietnamiensis]
MMGFLVVSSKKVFGVQKTTASWTFGRQKTHSCRPFGEGYMALMVPVRFARYFHVQRDPARNVLQLRGRDRRTIAPATPREEIVRSVRVGAMRVRIAQAYGTSDSKIWPQKICRKFFTNQKIPEIIRCCSGG